MRSWFRAFALTVMAVASPQPVSAADQISDGQWFHQFLSTTQAQQISAGEGVVVAVIDSGVDAKHPDLAGSVLPGRDLTTLSPNGTTDNNGHGTVMASLIAAHGRVRGIAPAAKILPIRAGIDEVSPDLVAAGIEWAVDQGAKVISISSAGGAGGEYERQEVAAALAADVVVVAGAGNRPQQSSIGFPAAFPGVVAVGGVDKAGNHASVSASGPQMVIAAPSDSISGANRNGQYSIGTGTSNAAAIVAGAAALIRSKFPQMKASEVVRRLTATAIDKGAPGRDPEYGFGVLNLVDALTKDIPAATDSATAQEPRPEPARLLLFVAVPVAALVITAIVIAIVLSSRRRNRWNHP